MYQPASQIAFSNPVKIDESPLRQAMLLGAKFASACQGAIPVMQALTALQQAMNAETLTLARIVRDKSHYLIATTTNQHTLMDKRAAAFADDFEGGSGILTTGHILQDKSDRAQCALILQANPNFADILIVREGDMVMLTDFAAMAIPIWAARRGGIAIDAMSALRNPHRHQQGGANDVMVKGRILSAQNPAGLTPTEYRVAIALRDGLSPASIGKQLNMAMSTVRTHLRNVYGKTGLHSMLELTHRLHADTA